MGSSFDRDLRRRTRAGHIHDVLQEMWGDELPPSPDPMLSLIMDAVAIDDDFGREQRLIVQDDGLTHEHLREVLRELVRTGAAAGAEGTGGAGMAAGEGLSVAATTLDRLLAGIHDTSVHDTSTDDASSDDVVSASSAQIDLPSEPWASLGMAALPGPGCGAWELDFATQRVNLEALTALLMGVGDTPGSYPLEEFLDGVRIHAEDRDRVQAALDESLQTGRPYHCRFRSLLGDGSYAWRVSSARVVPAPSAAPRLIGFVTADARVR